MRISGIYIVVLLVLLAGCRKDTDPAIPQNSMEGEWKLIMVIDKSTGSQFFKLPGTSGDVIIRFTSNSFSGHTIMNIIGGDFSFQNNRDITFNFFSMSKVMEDEWGSMFVAVLEACGLQSVSPCQPSKVSFQGNKLIIRSPLRYDLTLVRN